jgi:hypothetical protein
MESPDTSPFIAKYVVTPPVFDEFSCEFVSEAVGETARLWYAENLKMEDMVSMLKGNGESKVVDII